ncbi:MAG: GGDEF domain-containing protein [Gemmatimonadaceae bacterium]|nr:GGDEF domain-containing protein [Gemmatimonadaceae bacterium]
MLSFFSKQTKPAPAVADEPAVSATPVTEKEELSRETGIVLDALGSLLQLYAKHAFDTELKSGDEIRTLIHQWKMHGLVGSQRPDHPDDKPGSGVFYRDWKGLIHAFGEQRRDESKYVTRVLDDFRDVTWAFVSAVHTVVVEEHTESRIASDQLSRMRVAVESNSTDLMKREALAVVTVMEKLIEHRKERQQEQFAVLADKLKNLGRELEDARRESTMDGLTGLSNRKAFDDYLGRSIELHTLLGQPGSLMMVDIDSFKAINDTYGHPVGDAALRQVASTLSRTFLRRVDFVARYGGDEFAIILQETGANNAALLAERLRKAVAELPPLEVQGGVEPPRITLSVGIGELSVSDTGMDWVKRADAALYHAKRDGRDRVHAISEN